MQENKTVNCHCRLHDKNGYVMSIDLECDVQDAAKHILKLRDEGLDEFTYCEGCGEIISEGNHKGFMCDDCIQGDIKTINDRMSDLEAKVATVDNQRAAHAREVERREKEWNDESDTEWEE